MTKSDVINVDFTTKAVTSNSGLINVAMLSNNSRQLRAGLIAPAQVPVTDALAVDHSAEPIKSVDKINEICAMLVDEGRYRDYMLFVVGINFGLRASDLRELRFSSLINNDFTFKETVPVFEKKTRNTRKRKKNRYLTINSAVIEAVTLFLENTPGVCLSDHLFKSESNNIHDPNQPLTVRSMDRIIKRIAAEAHLGIRASTHTLRKTWAYHQMLISNNDSRKLLLLSKMMGHSSVSITLDYIGITDDEIRDAYLELNLGSSAYYKKYCHLNSSFYEATDTTTQVAM